MNAAGRSNRVIESLARADDGRGVDALAVSNLTNIRWLTGFTGSNAWVVVGAAGMTLLTDGRYGEQASAQLAASGVDAQIKVCATTAAIHAELAALGRQAGRCGFESASVTVDEHHRLQAAGCVDWIPLVGVVEAGRRTKDNAELALIERAARIADLALAETVGSLQAGITEAEVRDELERRMRRLGADGPSYETIVAAGPINGARPHHRPTETVLADGDLVVIDVGALVDGYHSDMTRTFVVGVPTDEQVERYELVLAAQLAGLAAVRPGVAGSAVDAAARQVITDAGLGEWFSHGTGHGVGLLIHEDPWNTTTSTDTLAVGDVVTVEPGVYRGGFGGIRVEDLVVVTGTGCRRLTTSPKDSLCPPSPPTT